jgi:hypothetical protein
MNHKELLVQFWNEFVEKGAEAATKFCNLYSNGIAVPTFIKIKPPNSRISYTCINIQEYLHDKHIEGLKLGHDKGVSDPRTSNIWYRLMRDANMTLKDDLFPKFEIKNLKITFHEVKCIKSTENGSVEVLAGYIIFDYT